MNNSEYLTTLLEKVAKHEFEAFDALYRATSPKLLGVAIRIMNDREQAEDILQESFLSAWNNFQSYRSGASAPMTWLTTIVRNKCFDALRQRQLGRSTTASELSNELGRHLDPNSFADTLADNNNPQENLENVESKQQIGTCLHQLESLQRQAIALAFFHDLSHREVAVQLALPIGTVKTWIRRGLEKLRSCLAGLGAL